MTAGRSLLLASVFAVLASCGSTEDADEKLAPAKSGQAQASIDPVIIAEGETLGTPMAERVAVLGLLNKRNGQTRDVELKPGQAIRFDKVVVRLRACEKTAPWESRPDQGAFVQLLVRERPRGTTDAERWRQVFSGWLFKENPTANIIEHPVYDVAVKACRMSFPGEEDTVEEKSSPDTPTPVAKKPSSAPQTPAPGPAVPVAPAEPAEEPTTEA